MQKPEHPKTPNNFISSEQQAAEAWETQRKIAAYNAAHREAANDDKPENKSPIG